jgi:hypothetical protein
VGGWLVFIPPLVMIVMTALVLIIRSDTVKIAGIWILGGPWIAVVIGPVYSALQTYQVDRRIAGDDNFRGPQRKLAHAINSGDAALVRTLIPLAGDLNKQYREETLLSFAIDKLPMHSSPDSAASLEIVRLLRGRRECR